MNVTFSTREILTEDQERAMATNLQVPAADLEAALQKLALVAMADLLDMVTGRAREKLTTEAYQKRLEYMILYYYRDHLPREDEVVRLFQVTPQRAKTLLTNIQAARRFSIDAQMKETVARALRLPQKKDEATVILSIASPSVVSAIEAAIKANASGGSYGALSRRTDKVDVYEISVLTYNRIAVDFGVDLIKEDDGRGV
jgi:hypothetical protein